MACSGCWVAIRSCSHISCRNDGARSRSGSRIVGVPSTLRHEGPDSPRLEVLRVGELPPSKVVVGDSISTSPPHYLTPFEKFALAMSCQKARSTDGVSGAIYLTGGRSELAGTEAKDRLLETMLDSLASDGAPSLPPGHDYITIWGYAARASTMCRRYRTRPSGRPLTLTKPP